jgi:hypothetical protein
MWKRYHAADIGYRTVDGTDFSSPTRSRAGTRPHASLAPAWIGQVATICDETGRNYVLLPATEQILEEMRSCEAAQDDLGISLMVADEKLLLVSCGTKVKILEAAKHGRLLSAFSAVSSLARRRSHLARTSLASPKPIN